MDALSAFFMVLLGSAAFGVTVYASSYFKSMVAGSLALLSLWYHLFLAGMAMVLLADDAYAFMVAWEVMALSSYFLVTTDHKIPEIRRAGFLYLLIAHVGAISLLLTFGVLQGGQGDYTFDTMRFAQFDAVLGIGRISDGTVRFRRQGGIGTATRVAAGSAPRSTLTRVRTDVGRDAQDCHLWPAAVTLICSMSRSPGGERWRWRWA